MPPLQHHAAEEGASPSGLDPRHRLSDPPHAPPGGDVLVEGLYPQSSQPAPLGAAAAEVGAEKGRLQLDRGPTSSSEPASRQVHASGGLDGHRSIEPPSRPTAHQTSPARCLDPRRRQGLDLEGIVLHRCLGQVLPPRNLDDAGGNVAPPDSGDKAATQEPLDALSRGPLRRNGLPGQDAPAEGLQPHHSDEHLGLVPPAGAHLPPPSLDAKGGGNAAPLLPERTNDLSAPRLPHLAHSKLLGLLSGFDAPVELLRAQRRFFHHPPYAHTRQMTSQDSLDGDGGRLLPRPPGVVQVPLGGAADVPRGPVLELHPPARAAAEHHTGEHRVEPLLPHQPGLRLSLPRHGLDLHSGTAAPGEVPVGEVEPRCPLDLDRRGAALRGALPPEPPAPCGLDDDRPPPPQSHQRDDPTHASVALDVQRALAKLEQPQPRDPEAPERLQLNGRTPLAEVPQAPRTAPEPDGDLQAGATLLFHGDPDKASADIPLQPGGLLRCAPDASAGENAL
mmetsp:Transcript_60265/g.173901  ORF Transcript_60265/g.173901 Transcript_60265/m.173901 type:complete len:505 (-) Transcript_60265:1937-3451(-)